MKHRITVQAERVRLQAQHNQCSALMANRIQWQFQLNRTIWKHRITLQAYQDQYNVLVPSRTQCHVTMQAKGGLMSRQRISAECPAEPNGIGIGSLKGLFLKHCVTKQGGVGVDFVCLAQPVKMCRLPSRIYSHWHCKLTRTVLKAHSHKKSKEGRREVLLLAPCKKMGREHRDMGKRGGGSLLKVI